MGNTSVKRKKNVQKRNRGLVVYSNNSQDSSSNGAKEQKSIEQGTRSYAAYKSQLESAVGKVDDDSHDGLDEYDDDYTSGSSMSEIDDAYEDAHKKFNRRRFDIQSAKRRQDKSIEHVLSAGLGHSVDVDGGFMSSHSLPGVSSTDELYNDGVLVRSYAEDVIDDYGADIKKAVSGYKKRSINASRDSESVDIDGDGNIDYTIKDDSVESEEGYVPKSLQKLVSYLD